MDQETLARFTALEEKINKIYVSVEKTRKYFMWTLIVTILTVVVPAVLLAIAVPFSFQATLAAFKAPAVSFNKPRRYVHVAIYSLTLNFFSHPERAIKRTVPNTSRENHGRSCTPPIDHAIPTYPLGSRPSISYLSFK
jgi:hypothetical protein